MNPNEAKFRIIARSKLANSLPDKMVVYNDLNAFLSESYSWKSQQLIDECGECAESYIAYEQERKEHNITAEWYNTLLDILYQTIETYGTKY